MFDRDLPQPGEIWTHFKNNEKPYYIIGKGFNLLEKENPYGIIYTESWLNIIKELAINFSFIVRHTENSQLYKVKLIDGIWVLYEISEVFLENNYTPNIVGWVRPIDNFMEILNNSTNKEFSNYYRFTKKL